jgi:hypothetical protein
MTKNTDNDSTGPWPRAGNQNGMNNADDHAPDEQTPAEQQYPLTFNDLLRKAKSLGLVPRFYATDC